MAGQPVRCELVNAPAHDGVHEQLPNCRHPLPEAGADVTLAGSVDAVCGLGISVYQDHANVRVSIAGAEAKLDIAAVAALMTALRDAALDARLWEIGRDNAAAAGPRSLASCGHPADADGECSCSYWPERAPHV
jgi:hypothetical protein